MSSERGNFPNYTRGGYGRGRVRPDHGNRHYLHGGTGRGSGSSAAFLSFPPEADLKKGLDTSEIIETVPLPPRPSGLEDLPIDNVQYVASYNWVDTEQATIVVPGSPAVWTGRPVPFTLQPDSGEHFVDQNGARMSEHPLLPLFAAADVIHENKEPPVDWPAVDVISDRNGLRKLLRWLNPSEGKQVRDFRIDVELVGSKTIVLNRWEGRTREPPTGKSYGFAFEAATSRPAEGCPISGHHRTITYDLLDMKMVVRFEVDACLSTESDTATSTKTGASDTKRSGRESPVLALDELADALENMDLHSPPHVPKSPSIISSSSSSPVPPPSSPPPALKIIPAGTQVPQESLLEVASRSKYFIDQLDWNELYPQLAIAQTPGLRLGVHERGTFNEMREMQVDGDGSVGTGTSGPPALEAQKRETAAQFARLARVLEDVQELAIERGPGPRGSFGLVCEGGELRVYARTGMKRSFLPPDVRKRFYRAATGPGTGTGATAATVTATTATADA